MKVLVVGAGITGSVIARELALCDLDVTVIDSRGHTAGNCHTERDPKTSVMQHVYGPHIFHTDDVFVWKYVNSFVEFKSYINRVKAVTGGEVYSLPINLHTINQFFKKKLSPKEAEVFIKRKSEGSVEIPRTFEEQALKFLGKELYEAFFKGYTEKQWGCSPSDLPASILKRLPVRFNYNDNYFNHEFQGIPVNGYTELVDKILEHENIKIKLNTIYEERMLSDYDFVFYTGTVDGFYNYKLGRLPYRTLRFEKEIFKGDAQGCAVINYCDRSETFTRISEHKHFAPWEKHEKTILIKEYSSECKGNDIPYYPIKFAEKNQLLNSYQKMALKEKKVVFTGRLGKFAYMDMDVAIKDALNIAKEFTHNL